jgi:hypothetical protein
MGKRNTTSTATATTTVENLNNEFAVGNVEERQAKLATIPKPRFIDSIPWELVFSDRAFNTREEESYAIDQNQGLYNSLVTYGLTTRGGDNMSFSLQQDGRWLIISGNLRYAMMSNRIAEIVKLNQATIDEGRPEDVQPIPFQTLFGLAFEGLTRDQETDLMADHLLKKGLTKAELCREIGEACYRLGLTDERAAVKYGMLKNNVQRLRMRYYMPTVYDNFKKEVKGDPTIPFISVKQTSLTPLYSEYVRDQKAGCVWREEGINFKKAWNEYTRSNASTPPVPIKSVKSNDILEQANSLAAGYGETPEVVAADELLSWAANVPKNGAVNIQAIIQRLQDYCEGLRTENKALRNEVESLRSNSDDQLATIQQSNDRIRDLETENNDLKNENAQLLALVSELESKALSQ